MPKCLVPINDSPLLDLWFSKLESINVERVLVNTHYYSEQVDNHIQKSRYRTQVETSYEEDLLGTAGTLMKHIDFFQGKEGLLIHADNYCEDDLKKFITAHRTRPENCLLTMLVFETETPHSCGIVETDGKGVVCAIHEKVANPPGNLANGAVYLLSSDLIKELSRNRECAPDFIEIVKRLIGSIYAYKTSGFFIDIGEPTAYKKALDFDKERL